MDKNLNVKITSPVVSVNWLYKNRNAKNLLIFNATIPKAIEKQKKGSIVENQLINTRFFDLKNVFSEQEALYPNTLLSAKKFEIEAQKIGVNANSCLVVYDEIGVYSSARVWWMFRSMGFENIAVLNGGFPAWKKANYPVEKKKENKRQKGDFKAVFTPSFFCDKQTVLQSLTENETLILDARSTGRFYGKIAEPRKQCRSGHIPTSKSMPYTNILIDGKLKSVDKLKTIFNAVNKDKKRLIFSCGSGVTACILALGATLAGEKNKCVYDGSWTEWGSELGLPIEK